MSQQIEENKAIAQALLDLAKELEGWSYIDVDKSEDGFLAPSMLGIERVGDLLNRIERLETQIKGQPFSNLNGTILGRLRTAYNIIGQDSAETAKFARDIIGNRKAAAEICHNVIKRACDACAGALTEQAAQLHRVCCEPAEMQPARDGSDGTRATSVRKNPLGCIVPPCPGCGSLPAADDVDDDCPNCGRYQFICGIARHIPLPQGQDVVVSPILQQMQSPLWERIPPSQVKSRPARGDTGTGGGIISKSLSPPARWAAADRRTVGSPNVVSVRSDTPPVESTATPTGPGEGRGIASVSFDQIPVSVWSAMDWFLCAPESEKPSVAAVRAAIGCGLLYGTSIGWLLDCRPPPPELNTHDPEAFRLREQIANTKSNNQAKKTFVTNLGLAALHWRADAEARETPPNVTTTESTTTLAEQTDPVSRAIALLLAADKEGKPINITDLQEIVGCSRSTLYRDPLFKATRKAMKEKKRANIPKGSKTKEGIEAGYDPDEE